MITEVALAGTKPLHTGEWIAEYEPWIAPVSKNNPLQIVAIMATSTDLPTVSDISETAATRDRGSFTGLIEALLHSGL